MDTIGRLRLQLRNLAGASPANLSRLISWCENPTPRVQDIEGILADLTEDDLVYAMLIGNGIPHRLAWLEYGRRQGHVKPAFGLSISDDVAHLEISAEGFAVHGLATFGES